MYTPAILGLAILVAVVPPALLGADFGDWFYRALVLLVIGCPCALVISTPVSIVASLAGVQGEPNLVAEPAVVRQMTPLARQYNWRLTVYLRGSEIVGLAPPESTPVGLAVDLGTIKIAASLVDLATGAELAVAGALNPQIGYGEDVISRRSRHRLRHDVSSATANSTLRRASPPRPGDEPARRCCSTTRLRRSRWP